MMFTLLASGVEAVHEPLLLLAPIRLDDPEKSACRIRDPVKSGSGFFNISFLFIITVMLLQMLKKKS